MAKNIEVKCTIKNGSLVTEANAPKIFVFGKKGAFHNHIVGTQVDTENYTPRYALVKEEEGWIAREVTFNTGILGHTNTLRQQIIRIGLSGGFHIVFED
ncbi:hypothetical protein LL266_16790 [Vibrio anguillarum]|uniref:hypothetical protein n=1 Tax=Vibrio anguillarum TaxID=55601 RepID=UPI001D18F0F8|nr:hypothetical protein [Vibrio anguillarum]MCC4238148.1 hypothetical protein [Vibrio anguillarum]